MPPSTGKRPADDPAHPAKQPRRSGDGAAAGRESVFGAAAATAYRVQQRLKQVGYGKNTIAYDNYRRQVPKNSRDGENPAHLRTPNARAAGISKRQFDGRLREWRSKLHVFWGDDDAESAAGASAGTEGARPAAADAGLVGSSAGFSLDDYLMGDEMDDALDGVGGQAGGDTARPEPQPLRPGAELAGLGAQPPARGGGLSVRERLDAVKRKAAAAASATAEDIYGGWQEDDLLI
ncbi:hypothetical protein EMIHUDRAFT_212626 [Emiliania huxleyi CCMP1516]|uniref:Histone RNA hairpin-binding protein RNA-binding domain-containing protein n=2 Tax=Emiliania huxleyi TaxID=2903 RepID=A0A0D3IQI9_EMIH1|nr:hypothetical protein EMIHUDRAFT_212626 [Emiliania huxleyi CCMP1516]EOD13524.1 hypothetical protein EMIHUDRAFT_212626 [Emiliania huxleyi CCMP1516]|eukprot:XP_005765953.1 hypothetical protein EMIHUDRAFT_212626 [Emiliania huxleyi CCMP1516]